MSLLDRDAVECDPFPQNLPRALIDCVSHESMSGSIVGGITISVKAWAKRRSRIAADRSRDEDAIAPDDRARMAEARNRPAPEHVFTRLDVPPVWKILFF